MEWSFRGDQPIYTQLVQRIKQAIVSGELQKGQRLPSVRDLATEAGVNPNTMQRALQELEREGMVFSQRTAGRFVTEDEKLIDGAKRAFAAEHIRVFLDGMSKLGYGREEIFSLLREEKEDDHGDSGM